MESSDVYAITRTAYVSIFRYRRVFLYLALPVLLTTMLYWLLQAHASKQSSGWLSLTTLIEGTVASYFELVLALVWHRTILINGDTPEYLFKPSRRHGKFFKYGFLYFCVLFCVIVVPAFILDALPMHDSANSEHILIRYRQLILATILYPLTIFIVARFSLVFPAASIDEPISLKISWKQTSGISWSIAAILLLVQLPFTFATETLNYLGGVTGKDGLKTIIKISSSLIGGIGFLVLISAVSLIYAWRKLNTQNMDKLG
jgi:hypothetical protein